MSVDKNSVVFSVKVREIQKMADILTHPRTLYWNYSLSLLPIKLGTCAMWVTSSTRNIALYFDLCHGYCGNCLDSHIYSRLVWSGVLTYFVDLLPKVSCKFHLQDGLLFRESSSFLVFNYFYTFFYCFY